MLTAQGWTLSTQTRRNKGKQYVYASRKVKGTRKNDVRYICALSKIDQLTQEALQAQLNKPPKAKRKPA